MRVETGEIEKNLRPPDWLPLKPRPFGSTFSPLAEVLGRLPAVCLHAEQAPSAEKCSASVMEVTKDKQTFMCEICDKLLSSSASRKRHLKCVHGLKLPPVIFSRVVYAVPPQG